MNSFPFISSPLIKCTNQWISRPFSVFRRNSTFLANFSSHLILFVYHYLYSSLKHIQNIVFEYWYLFRLPQQQKRVKKKEISITFNTAVLLKVELLKRMTWLVHFTKTTMIMGFYALNEKLSSILCALWGFHIWSLVLTQTCLLFLKFKNCSRNVWWIWVKFMKEHQ